MAGEKKKNYLFEENSRRSMMQFGKDLGPSALLFHKGQTHNARNTTMAPVSDTGEKTPFEDDVNRYVYMLEGTQTATHCKQQRGKVSPEL